MEQKNRISYYRRKLGLSQEELGERLAVSSQTIERWEAGEESPSVDRLARLRTIFGVSVDEILGLTPDTATDPPSASAASVAAPTPPMPATPAPAAPPTPPTTPRPMTAPLFDPSMYMPPKPPLWLRILSAALMILSVVSLFGGMMLAGFLSARSEENSVMFYRYLWVLYLGLPFSIGSFVVGIVFNRKRFPGMGVPNMVIGAFMSLFLLIFGSFPFILQGAEEPVTVLETELGVDVPSFDQFHSSISTDISGNTVSVCTIRFTETNADKFKEQVVANYTFLGEIPDHLKDVQPPSKNEVRFDGFLLYNRTNDTCNIRPDAPSDLLALYFDDAYNELTIVLYRWEGN